MRYYKEYKFEGKKDNYQIGLNNNYLKLVLINI